MADNSKSKWGRRRPFMIGGSLAVGFCLLVLGWTKEIVGMFVTEPGMVSAQEYSTMRTISYNAIAGQILHDCPGGIQHLRSRLCYQRR